ncbi:MAG: hypothetical protein HY985_13175 [Magnetospirillum sp.]|nr:hypothetical protein [Magnetospirillum sp.]
MRMRLRALAVLLALAASGPAGAADAGPYFYKVQPMQVEMWDKEGLFHLVVIDIQVEFPEQPKSLNKTVSERIVKAIQVLPYEELVKVNPATVIKALALDVIRRDKGGEQADEVRIIRLMFR